MLAEKQEKGADHCAQPNVNTYLNFAETGEKKQRLALVASFPWLLPCSLTRGEKHRSQAVRSLVRLGYTCYQACTCRLSTRYSLWDLNTQSV